MRKKLFVLTIFIAVLTICIFSVRCLKKEPKEKSALKKKYSNTAKINAEVNDEKTSSTIDAKEKHHNVTVSTSEVLLSDEEKIQKADIIVRGVLESKEQEGTLEGEGYSLSYSVFKVKATQYLLNDISEEKDYIAFSYGATELPDELEYGQEYIFYFTRGEEIFGKDILSLVSLTQSVYEQNDDLKWENAYGEEQTLHSIENDIKEFAE